MSLYTFMTTLYYIHYITFILMLYKFLKSSINCVIIVYHIISTYKLPWFGTNKSVLSFIMPFIMWHWNGNLNHAVLPTAEQRASAVGFFREAISGDYQQHNLFLRTGGAINIEASHAALTTLIVELTGLWIPENSLRIHLLWHHRIYNGPGV